MRPLFIGEVARRSGIRPSALRYYEDAGILPIAARVRGRRCYDSGVFRRIDVLRFAQQAGFTLQEIKTLFHGFGVETSLSARWQSLARAKLEELSVLEKRIRRMRRALELGLKCGCVRVEDCSLSPSDVTETNKQRTRPRRARLC
jgi:MerR family transcriptional regulator, redox-sensitive transcriptional activator SoxR